MAGRLYTSPPKFSQVPSFINSEVPVYRLRDDIFTGDTLFLKGTTLETDEDFEPNLAMFPLNDISLKKYRAFLVEYDKRGEEYAKQEKKAYVAKLPAFEREWLKVNGLSKNKGIHLVHAVDISPSILGAPPTVSKVRAVDMSMIPQVPFEDGTAVGKGNTGDRDMSSAAAVRASTAN